jgi:hypothetical protein
MNDGSRFGEAMKEPRKRGIQGCCGGGSACGHAAEDGHGMSPRAMKKNGSGRAAGWRRGLRGED